MIYPAVHIFGPGGGLFYFGSIGLIHFLLRRYAIYVKTDTDHTKNGSGECFHRLSRFVYSVIYWLLIGMRPVSTSPVMRAKSPSRMALSLASCSSTWAARSSYTPYCRLVGRLSPVETVLDRAASLLFSLIG